jgi:hypothetical protein
MMNLHDRNAHDSHMLSRSTCYPSSAAVGDHSLIYIISDPGYTDLGFLFPATHSHPVSCSPVHAGQTHIISLCPSLSLYVNSDLCSCRRRQPIQAVAIPPCACACISLIIHRYYRNCFPRRSCWHHTCGIAGACGKAID